MREFNPLVLEILRQNDVLVMSLFERQDVTSTWRHYSRLPVSFPEIYNLCQEAISILNRADKNIISDTDLARDLRKAGQLLWDSLLSREIKERLRAARNLDLIISLDEELINIPWELLYNGEDFLCLKFNAGRVVRTVQKPNPPQYRSHSAPGALKMLILANPTNDLPSAYLEGIFIRNQFDRKRREIKIDFKSTDIDTLYVKKNLCDYDILHFAGHCEYDSQDAGNSGWVLSNGRLTAQDIYTIGQTSSLPGLIFSNACHSAKAKEVHTLASAFLFSGVRHYLGTIRRIEDQTSFAFARAFYAHLISGRSVGESVRMARVELMKGPGVTNLWWANYLLYGDPNLVLFRARSTPKAVKPRRDFALYKKYRVPAGIAIAIISIIVFLYISLPTINPNTYLLFWKSRQTFLKGKNQETLLFCNSIIKKEPFFLEAYPLLADTYHRLGDKAQALKYYFEYALQSQKRQDIRHLLSAYLGIGWLYHLSGDYPKAFDFYNQAITSSRQNKDKLSQAKAMERLAVWYIDKEDYDLALELLLKSAEASRERQQGREQRYNLACVYFDIALVFTNKGDFNTAKEFYDKSRLLFERLKLKYELSDYYFNLGEICLFEKEYQQALSYYLQGLGIDQEHGHKPNIASDYNMLGELYLAMDNLSEAERFFNDSVSLAGKIDARPELAAAYYNLGLLYKHKNRKNKAREYLRLAQEIYQHIDTPDYQRIKELFSQFD